MEYLGHIITGQGVSTGPAKIEAIVNWPVPKNQTELRSFLGLSGYYRRFIKDYGIICRPMFDSLKKDSFSWQPQQQAAFEQLKLIMTQAPVLTLPDHTQPFILEADASGFGIGDVLMQQGKPLSFMSKTIGPKAAGMSTYDKEAVAILEALKKWKHYFAHSTLIIRTDQQSVKYIHDQRLTQGIQHKLLIKLLGYDYRIEYKKGRENRVADALSRMPTESHTFPITMVTPAWITAVIDTYTHDPKCQKLIAELTLDTDSHKDYTFKSGILRYKGKIYIGQDQDVHTKLVASFHETELGGHSGERATTQILKLVFHWPNMKQTVSEFIRECPVCQINKSEHCPSPGLLQPLPIPKAPWADISMNFVEGLPTSENKNMVLVVVDRRTKYAHFVDMKHPITVKQVVGAFANNIVKLHGLPQSIVTDRDRIFTSHLWQDLFRALGVTLNLSTSYHPYRWPN